jgi:hypothetical protein
VKIYFNQGKILVISERIINILSKLTGFDGKKGEKRAMGFTMFPFIILRNITHPMTEQWINHESIHIRQFIESFGLFWIISKLEYLYARIFLKYSHIEANRYEAIEQEAYLNQHNKNYHNNRPLFNTLKYIRHKTNFYTDDKYQVIIKK